MAQFTLVPSSQFKKDLKKYKDKKKEKQAILHVLELLSEGGTEKIPQAMKPHLLLGNYKGFWECHIMPDLLIIWDEQTAPTAEIYLVRLGTHAALFKK